MHQQNLPQYGKVIHSLENRYKFKAINDIYKDYLKICLNFHIFVHQDCSISPGSFSRLRQSVGISDKLNLQPVHRWQICSASAQLWASIKLSNLAIFCNIWMQRLSWDSVISTPLAYQKRRHLSLGLRCLLYDCNFISCVAKV